MANIKRPVAWVVTLLFVVAIAIVAKMQAAAAAEPAAEPTILLHGKVFGPKDRPVAGARLYLNVDEWTDPIELGRSDADGSYRFEVPESTLRRTVTGGFQYNSTKASLLATAEGLGAAWAELPDVKGGRYAEMQSEYANDLRLPKDFPIAGRIIDIGGQPVEGAVVSVRGIHNLSDPRWFKMHPAIATGDTELMTREQVDVNNWATRLYPTAWKVIAAGTTDKEGRFQLTGVGYDRGVALHVTGPRVRRAYVSVLTRDDVDRFTQAIREKYPRSLRPDGYFYPRREDKPDGPQGVQLFGPKPTIEVDPARSIAGVVRDASTGEPIANMRVQIANSFGIDSVTDRDGRYRIMRGEARSTIFVYARVDNSEHADRYLNFVRRIDDAPELGEIVVDMDVPRGVTINGRVVEEGTERPIVSAPRTGVHFIQPGPLMAGNVFYFPLATNKDLRGAPTGLYFEGLPPGSRNYYRSALIDGEGRFRLAVPPGPGVLMVRAAAPLSTYAQFSGVHKESTGLHQLFPYERLKTRIEDDGGPKGDAETLPGFAGPITVTGYHAYRVINPPPDARALDVTLPVPRAPSRLLRFADPAGNPVEGVTVQGLLPSQMSLAVELEGSEVEILALEPGNPREVAAVSADGNLIAQTSVDAEDRGPLTIQLQPAASVAGHLLDAATGRPLVDYRVSVRYAVPKDTFMSPRAWLSTPAKGQSNTDADGRFHLRALMPGLAQSISLRGPKPEGAFNTAPVYRPEPLQEITLEIGEIRELGDIRIAPDVDAE